MNKIRYYSSFVMVAIYIALGLLFLFTDIGIDTFPAYRKQIGCIMIAYGILRTVLNIKKIKQEQDDRN